MSNHEDTNGHKVDEHGKLVFDERCHGCDAPKPRLLTDEEVRAIEIRKSIAVAANVTEHHLVGEKLNESVADIPALLADRQARKERETKVRELLKSAHWVDDDAERERLVNEAFSLLEYDE